MKRVSERGHKFERMYRKTTLQVDDMKQRLNKRRAATDERNTVFRKVTNDRQRSADK